MSTSRKLHRVALPHLYYYINIDHQHRLVPFVRFIFDYPHLADLVHRIDLDDCDKFENDQVLENYFQTQPPISLPEPTIRYWFAKANGPEDVYDIRLMDLMLTKCHNLEFLDLTNGCGEIFDNQCFNRIRDNHTADTLFLSKLKGMTVRQWDGEHGFDFESVTTLISMTKIQTLTLWGCIGVTDIDDYCFPSLVELTISDSGLRQDEFVRIVKCCPDLQYFSYALTGSHRTDQDDLITAEQISSVLAPLGQTLRKLLLYLPFEEDKGGNPVGSMRNFSRLESLTIDITALAGEHDSNLGAWNYASLEATVLQYKDCLAGWLDLLPRSLQNLCILRHFETEWYHRDVRFELAMLADRATDFPNLETLTVDDDLGVAAWFEGTNIE